MQETVKKVLNGDFNRKKALLFLITALLTVIVWNLPIDSFGIEGLTIVQQRVIAIFVMAVMLWLTEAIPAWATSVVIIFVLLFFVSDSAFKIMQGSEAEMGKLLDYQGVMACFADPTIILFLGGFVLAIAATKSGLDVMMAKALIAPFGKRSENVLLGFMLITGIFSMFISNTATAAMMLTFLTPVFKSLPPSGKGRVALTMAIPIGANLGGMGTPIGTPPNAFAFKVLNDPAGLNLGLSFGDWMLIMAPMVLIMLIMAWVIIRKMFPFSAKTIELNIEGNMQHNWRTTVVAVTFLATIVLWVFGKQLGINAKLLGGDTLCSPEVGKLGGDAVNDTVICAQGGTMLDKAAAGPAFKAKYKKRFNIDADAYAASYYDQMLFIGDAMQKANSIDPSKVGAEIYKASYQGVAGTYAYDDKGNLKQAPITVLTFKNAAPTPLASY